MQEIEVKILEINAEAITQRLLALGATKAFDGLMLAQFYDFEDRRILANGEVLRVRLEGAETVMTYKKPISKGEAKIMEEHESRVESPSHIQPILQAMGLQIVKETRKHRTEFILPDGHVVIDDYQGALAAIPVFLEIESPTQEQVYHIASALGYGPESCKSWDTRDLIQHYGISG